MGFNRKRIKEALFFVCICLLFSACTETSPKVPTETEATTPVKVEERSSFSLKIFKTENGWGYDVFRNGKKYIRQATKPGVQGNKGFETELQAHKIGEFVIQKLEKGIIPPTVTATEIDSLITIYAN